MAGKLATAFVDVEARDKMDSGFQRIRGKLSEFVSQAGRLAAIPVGFAMGGAAAGIVGFLKSAIDAASDLGETQSKVEQVFGSSTAVVKQYADGVAKGYGVVKKEVLDSASMFALVAQGMGMGQSESAKFSVALAQLAIDASSFYNVPVSEALEKIRAGLTGESEPLRAFGVNLNEAAVAARAVELGLAPSTKAVGDYAKVCARASLITEGLSKAAGDLDRTSDSLSNQQRKLAGDWENMKAEVGEGLTPAMADLLKLVYEIGGALDGSFGADRESQVRGLGAAFQGLVDNLRYMANADITSGFEEAMLMMTTSVWGNAFGDKDRLDKLRNDRAVKLKEIDKAEKEAAAKNKPKAPPKVGEGGFEGPGGGKGANPDDAKAKAAEQAKKDAEKEAKRIQDEAKKMIADGMTPGERFDDALKRVKEQVARGNLDFRQAGRYLAGESGVDDALKDARRDRRSVLERRRDRLAEGGSFEGPEAALKALQEDVYKAAAEDKLLGKADVQIERLTQIKDLLEKGAKAGVQQARAVAVGRE